MKLPVIGKTKKMKTAPAAKATPKPTPWGLPPGFDLKEAERQTNLAREKEWEAEVTNRNAPPTWLGRRLKWLAPSHRARARFWRDRLGGLGL